MNDAPRTDPLAVRTFAILLRLGPRHFRAHEAPAVRATFAELHRDARRSGRRLAGAAALLAELPGLATLLWLAWREPRAVPHPDFIPARRRPMFDSLVADARYALRSLGRTPGVTAVCIATLALGVGANTAIFSLVNGVLVRPLGFRDPPQLVALGELAPDGPDDILAGSTSVASFLAWQAGARSASGMAAYNASRATLLGEGEPESLVGIASHGGLFDVLGVRPEFGRAIAERDEAFGAEPVVVLSHDTWQRNFGEDRAVIGRRIVLQGTLTTVIGVMPEGFSFPDGTSQFYVPARWSPDEQANRDQYYLAVVARLKAGASESQLRTEMDAVAARLRADWSQYNTRLRIGVVGLQETIVSGVRPRLYLLMGAVALVLLIACANLANLMLARATARRHEIAVRQALGAQGSRVVRQLLTEALVLTGLGGAAALLVGQGMMRALVAAHVGVLPRLEDVRMDGTVLAFTLGVAVAAGLLFGLAPALQLARAGTADALREDARAVGGRSALRGVLVVAELAMALMLLIGAGLLARSARELSRVRPGFEPGHLLTFRMSLGDSATTRLAEALRRLREIPGVQSATAVSQLPVTGRGIGAWFNIYGRPVPAGETPPGEAYRVVAPGYFEAMRIPLLRGRALTDDDRRDHSPSVVINEALARQYWPNGDPLGAEIYLGAPDNRLFERATIVGVVGDTRDAGFRSDPLPEVFIPHAVAPYWGAFDLAVRTTGDPLVATRAVRDVMREVAPGRPLRDVRTMDDVLRASAAEDRLALRLLGGIALVAVLMAAIGVFGVLAYVVARRTRELGLRMALGAAPSLVRGLVVRQGLRLAAIGVVLGTAGALALNRVMKGLVYGVGTTDALTYALAAAGLVLVAALASWMPARRATRVDPMLVLRDG